MAVGTLTLQLFLALSAMTKEQQASFENMNDMRDINDRITDTQQKLTDHMDEKDNEVARLTNCGMQGVNRDNLPVAMPKLNINGCDTSRFGSIATGVDAADGFIGYCPQTGKGQTYSAAADKYIGLAPDALSSLSDMVNNAKSNDDSVKELGISDDVTKAKEAIESFVSNYKIYSTSTGTNGQPADPEARKTALEEIKKNPVFTNYLARRITEDGGKYFDVTVGDKKGIDAYNANRDGYFRAASDFIAAEIVKGDTGATLDNKVPVWGESTAKYVTLMTANGYDPTTMTAQLKSHVMGFDKRQMNGAKASPWEQVRPVDIVIKPFRQAKAFLNSQLRRLNSLLNNLTMKQKRIDLNIQMYEKMIAKAEQAIPKALNYSFGGGGGQG